MDPEEEAKRMAVEDAEKTKTGGSNSGDDSPITKGELRNEMRSMI
jgi:hypothetical protein